MMLSKETKERIFSWGMVVDNIIARKIEFSVIELKNYEFNSIMVFFISE